MQAINYLTLLNNKVSCLLTYFFGQFAQMTYSARFNSDFTPFAGPQNISSLTNK